MKIIVRSEKEKDLIERFLEVFNEFDCTETVEDLENEYPEDITIDTTEYMFVDNGFRNCKVEIGETNYMEIDHHNVTGKCTKCGKTTEGITDSYSVGYDDYLDYMSPESQKEWLCSDCMREE